MFTPARLDEYIRWLEGFIAQGGQITHAYTYSWQIAGFFLATGDFQLHGERGSSARHIIVPDNVHYIGSFDRDLGHNELFFMNGFRCIGRWVPVYKDRAFESLPGARELQEAKEAVTERRDRRIKEGRIHKNCPSCTC